MKVDSQIRSAANEAQRLLDELYSAGDPEPESALDQAGLRDGFSIVDSYLSHGETGLALEHLLYMVSEPSLKLSATSLADIYEAADALGMSSELARLPIA